MSIKCSLFGHSFDESTVEREREEQGSEVVITIREVQTCTRCGETRVVSENKEVTTLETPDDIDATPPDGADAETSDSSQPETAEIVGSESDGDSSPPETGSASAGMTDDTTTDQSSDTVETDPSTEATESPPTNVAQDSGSSASSTSDIDDEPPVTDDAEILDDDSDAPDRAPGEWPQETDEPESQPDADILTEAEPDSDESDQTDAEFVVDEDSQTQTNEWPSEDEIDAASEPESVGPGAVTAPDGSYVCRECGFSTLVEESSLREGDFCPECHRGTLVHVQDTN